MSRAGSRHENAVTERFFWSIKRKRMKHENFAHREITCNMAPAVETICDSARLHPTRGYELPDRFSPRS